MKKDLAASVRARLLNIEDVETKRVAHLTVVAKGGIEPPTRGFSVPCSTN